MRFDGVGKTLDRLLAWADENGWSTRHAELAEAHLAGSTRALGLSPEEIMRRLGPAARPVELFVLDAYLAARFGKVGDKNVVDAYLEKRAWREKPGAVAFLREVRDSDPALYQVERRAPGRLTVTDLLHDRDSIHVRDWNASEVLRPGHCFAGRIIHIGKTLGFSLGLLALSPRAVGQCVERMKGAIRDVHRHSPESVRSPGDAIDDSTFMQLVLRSGLGSVAFVDAFIQHALTPPKPPELVNHDGETLAPTTIRFPVRGSEDDVIEVLDDMSELERHEGPHWVWPGTSSETDYEGKTVETRVVLGRAEIVDGALTLQANSAERGERGRELLAGRLGKLVGTPLTSHQTLEETRKQVKQKPPPETSPETDALILDQIREHYRRTLDESVPALGNRTPRKAARTRQGRARVEEWIRGIEIAEARRAHAGGPPAMDAGWIREELKLPKP